MNELGEGDIDIIKAPIVIDNVSWISNASDEGVGLWYDEGRHWGRL